MRYKKISWKALFYFIELSTHKYSSKLPYNKKISKYVLYFLPLSSHDLNCLFMVRKTALPLDQPSSSPAHSPGTGSARALLLLTLMLSKLNDGVQGSVASGPNRQGNPGETLLVGPPHGCHGSPDGEADGLCSGDPNRS